MRQGGCLETSSTGASNEPRAVQYVLSGELVLVVEDLPVRVLGADDSAYYSSELRHSFRNPSTETTVRVICVNSPSNL